MPSRVSPIAWVLIALFFMAGSAHAATDAGPVSTGSVVAWSAVHALLIAGLFFASVAAFKIPGTGVPEVIAVTLLAALLVPAFLMGTAQWYEVLGIIAGIGLLAIEVFVIPGFGATGVVGLLLIFGGLVMIFVPDPHGPLPLTTVDFRNALAVLVVGMAGGMIALFTLGRFLPKLPRAHRLILDGHAGPIEHERIEPGDRGHTVSELRPMGEAMFGPVTVQVISHVGRIKPGTPVHVVAYSDGVATVEPIPSKSDHHSSQGKSS